MKLSLGKGWTGTRNHCLTTRKRRGLHLGIFRRLSINFHQRHCFDAALLVLEMAPDTNVEKVWVGAGPSFALRATQGPFLPPLGENKMAEREGFEPSVALRQRLISSQVPSTTQPPLRIIFEAERVPRLGLNARRGLQWGCRIAVVINDGRWSLGSLCKFSLFSLA